MKLKFVVIDFELSPRVKRILATIAVPALLLGGGAVAYANVPKTWSAGDALKAADLNANFSDVDTRIGTLEGKANGYVDLSTAQSIAGDKTFTGTVSLGGTLDVQGFGSVVSSAFNARSIAAFHNNGASNSAILFDTGAPPSTSSVRGFYMRAGSQMLSIARFDAAGVAPPTYDLMVAADGKVGIGIGDSAPVGALQVSGYGGWSASNYGTQLIVSTVPGASFPTIGILDSDNQNPWAITNAVGELRFSTMPAVGDGAPNEQLVTFYRDGRALNKLGVWAQLSDQRLKRDIRPIEGALETVISLKGMSFRWKDDKKDQELGRVEGFIAQDVERVKPQWVKVGSDGYRQLQTIGMDALLVEAIKEQQRQIEGLRGENRRLRAQVDRIEVGLAQLSRARTTSSSQAVRH